MSLNSKYQSLNQDKTRFTLFYKELNKRKLPPFAIFKD